MKTEIKSEPTAGELPNAARELAGRAADAAKGTAAAVKDAVKEAADSVEDTAGSLADATRDAAKRATDTAKEVCHSAALKAEDAYSTSKEYVRQNPVPVVIGAIAFGAAIGYLLLTPRRKPTFGERYADDPLSAVREAILGALAPVTEGVHKGYDSARDGAGKVVDRVHDFGTGRNGDSFSDHIGRIGSNLKFW